MDLIKRFLQLAAPNKNALILDFFAGSGTTAHAVMELNKEDGGNRKFILVQIPEINEAESGKKFPTIADICKKRIRRVITNFKSEHNLNYGFKMFRLTRSNYRVWENYEGKDVKKFKEQMKIFESPLVSQYNDIDVIYECIIKEGLELNAKIEKLYTKQNTIYKVADEESSFYICLDKSIQDGAIKKVKITGDDTFICIDTSLNDSQKTCKTAR